MITIRLFNILLQFFKPVKVDPKQHGKFHKGDSYIVLQVMYKDEYFNLCHSKAAYWSAFTGNSALLPSNVTDFALLPSQRFWQELVLLLDVMWPQSNQ